MEANVLPRTAAHPSVFPPKTPPQLDPAIIYMFGPAHCSLLTIDTGIGDSKILTLSQLPKELLRKYINGCHILHHHGLVEAYGHFSVRLSASTSLMSRYLALALLLASLDDLVICRVENGLPVATDAPRGQ